MTDEELLERARSFDAGPPPVTNQYVFEEDDNIDGRNMTIEYRGKTGWAICNDSLCVDKITGEYLYESFPTHREEDFIARTRFSTPQEAFAYLATWKAQRRAEALQSPHMIRWKDYLKGNAHD